MLTGAGNVGFLIGRLLTAGALFFTPSGSGAVQRTVADKLNERKTVEDFGAVGDGVTDDTAAFDAGITWAKANGRTLYLAHASYLANISITGTGLRMESASYSYYGGVSASIVPAVPTEPTVSIGDGTILTQGIWLNGIAVYGNNTADKGLLINGANNVWINGLFVRGFDEYGVRVTSSATQGTFFINVNGYHIQCGTTAGAKGLIVEYGDLYTTSTYFSHGAFDSTSTGSHCVEIADAGAQLHLSNTWIGGRDQCGVNFVDVGTELVASNVTIDATTSVEVLANLPENAAVSKYIRGSNIRINGRIGMPGGVTADFDTRTALLAEHSTLNNAHVVDSLYFQDRAASAWLQYPLTPTDRIYKSGNNMNMSAESGSLNASVGGYIAALLTSAAVAAGGGFRTYGPNEEQFRILTKSVSVSTPSGTTATATNLFPAGCVRLGVTARNTTAITGAASVDVGDGTDVDRWGAARPVAAGLMTDGTTWTDGTPVWNAAATSVVLTANGGNFSGGAVRVTGHYYIPVAPTS